MRLTLGTCHNKSHDFVGQSFVGFFFSGDKVNAEREGEGGLRWVTRLDGYAQGFKCYWKWISKEKISVSFSAKDFLLKI